MADAWSFEDCQDRLRAATQTILDKEKAADTEAQRAADAEAVYRKRLADAMRTYREAGKAVEESIALAKADVATLSRERDYAADRVKLAREQIENARDSRRTLWRLVEWARDRDLAARNGATT